METKNINVWGVVLGKNKMTRVMRKQTLRSLSFPYSKKDWRAGVPPFHLRYSGGGRMETRNINVWGVVLGKDKMTRVIRKQTLRSLSFPYAKKDWRAGVPPILLWV